MEARKLSSQNILGFFVTFFIKRKKLVVFLQEIKSLYTKSFRVWPTFRGIQRSKFVSMELFAFMNLMNGTKRP